MNTPENILDKSPEHPKDEQKNQTGHGRDTAEILSEVTDFVGEIISSGFEVITDVATLIGE